MRLVLMARGTDEPGEQRVSVARRRGELRMELTTQEPRMVRDLDHLDQLILDRLAGNDQACCFQGLAIQIVELVAMAMALADGGLANEQVGYINAHGTSTPANDRMETAAIRALFGDHAERLAVSSTKSMTGHLLGAAAAVEAVFSIMALQQGILPPTINQFTSDPECDLDYIPHVARQAEVEVALSNSLGFGGTNAAVAFRSAR